MTSDEEAQFQTLKTFRENSDLTQRQIAEKLGISLGKINFLIDALMEKGAIKMGNFRLLDTKLKKIPCLLTLKGINYRVRLTKGYPERKKAKFEALKAEIESIEQESQDQSLDHAQRGEVWQSPSNPSFSVVALAPACSHCPVRASPNSSYA
jgi:EPS-associated MarR family transcriptional regulator